MKLPISFSIVGLSFALASGALAQEHPMVVAETQHGVKELLKERLPEGTRVYIATSAAANAGDTDVEWELQTSKVDEYSTCIDGEGYQQLRIIALSAGDVKDSDYGSLKFTKDAAQDFADFMEENRFTEAPEDEKPDELSPEAWQHKYLMGIFADQFELDTGITPVIYTVQIPTSAIEGIDMDCGISLQDMEDLRRDFDFGPDNTVPRFDDPDTPQGNDGIIIPEIPMP